MPLSIVVPKKDLNRLLERAHPVADRKSSVPALANVLLSASGDTLTVSATDLYLGVSGTCACTGGAGVIALPAKDLFERVKAMPEGPIQIDVTDGAQAMIKTVGGARRYMLHGLPGADFPRLPEPEGDAIEMPADLFALLMHRTHFSISTDETRAHVNSALFEISDGKIRMVSTDGHRLSKMEARFDGRTTHMLIPLKAIGELRRLMDGAKGEKILLRQSASSAFFTVGGFTFSTKTIDSPFPPYESVVPQSQTHNVTMPRLAFVDALKAVQVASSERTGGIKVALSSGVVRVTAESPETGSASDEVPVDFSGADAQIGINSKYLLDVLGALDSDEVVFGMSGELDPTTLRPAGENAAEFVGVVMCMRI